MHHTVHVSPIGLQTLGNLGKTEHTAKVLNEIPGSCVLNTLTAIPFYVDYHYLYFMD